MQVSSPSTMSATPQGPQSATSLAASPTGRFYHSFLLLLLLVVVSFAVRAAWGAWTKPEPPAYSDANYYDATARSLARGEGYSVDDVIVDGKHHFEPGGLATAFFPPGFSAYLAVVYKVFGEDLTAAWLANSLIGALTLIPIFFLGRRWFGEAPALLATAMAAVLPSFIFWTPVLMSDVFFTFVFSLALLALLSSRREDNSFNVPLLVTAGVAIAIAALVRGTALTLVPVAILWWLIIGINRQQLLRATVGLVVGIAIVLVPWSVRNVIELKTPVVISTNLGYNLRIGHAPYSTGQYTDPIDLYELPSRDSQDREIVQNKTGTRRALSYALANPTREVELSFRKIIGLWRPDTDSLIWAQSYRTKPLPAGAERPLRYVLIATYLGVLCLGSFYLIRFRQRHAELGFILILFVAWTFVHIIFFGDPRYHMPLLSMLLPLAAAPMVAIAETMRLAGVPRPHTSTT